MAQTGYQDTNFFWISLSSTSNLNSDSTLALFMSSVVPLRCNRQRAGLSVLPPYQSSITQQEIRFTTLAGRYATHGTISDASWSPLRSSHKSFTGIIDLQCPQMSFSHSNAYAQREFPAETYVQVKRHVVSPFFAAPSTSFHCPFFGY